MGRSFAFSTYIISSINRNLISNSSRFRSFSRNRLDFCQFSKGCLGSRTFRLDEIYDRSVRTLGLCIRVLQLGAFIRPFIISVAGLLFDSYGFSTSSIFVLVLNIFVLYIIYGFWYYHAFIIFIMYIIKIIKKI